MPIRKDRTTEDHEDKDPRGRGPWKRWTRRRWTRRRQPRADGHDGSGHGGSELEDVVAATTAVATLEAMHTELTPYGARHRRVGRRVKVNAAMIRWAGIVLAETGPS